MKGKKRLIVELRDSNLSLLRLEGERGEKFEKIHLREIPTERLREKVASFTGKKRPPETLLLLSRSEVIQKEFVLAPGGETPLRQRLERKLEELLPYSPKEMAWGISGGLLLAIPEKPLKEKLRFLAAIGLYPDEILTEDQTLFWLLLERKEKSPLLFLEANEERVLSVFCEKGKSFFSRTFPSANFIPELSFSLLEKGARPEKILLSGEWGSEARSQIEAHFSCSLEKFEIPANGLVPSSLYGASLFGKYPAASLLPKEEKLKKRKEEKEKLLRETLSSFGLFFGTLLLAFLVQLAFGTREINKISREISRLSRELREVKEIRASLELLSKSQASKEGLLEFLKTLAEKTPSSIRLKELRIEGKEFRFKGESPSHGVLSEAVETLSQMSFLEAAKLEETRLRKRLNEDYFEFEVGAKWKA